MRHNGDVFRCAAGQHFGSRSQVVRWREIDEARVGQSVAAKAKAHDDYLEALRRWRHGAAAGDASDEYRRAMRDLTRHLLDVMHDRGEESHL